MCFILWTTVVLWKNPTWLGFAISGLAWGLAIGTKFTFGPLVLLYPLGVHLCASRGWTSTMLRRADAQYNDLPVSVFRRLLFVSRYWILHAAVACLVINTLYLFHETAMPIEKHDFIGMTFRSLTKPAETDWAAVKYAKSLVAMIPSPFPRSFLEGVDQQMADMDRPRGAYILGSRVPGEIYWFYLVGYAMKEQLALLLAAMLGLLCFVDRLLPSKLSRFFHGRAIVLKSLVVCEQFGTVEDNRSTLSAGASGSIQQHDRSLRSFCAFFLFVFGLFMTTQSNLVWNVRYLIPALPLIYLLVSFSVPSFEILFATKGIAPTGDGRPPVTGESRTVDPLFWAIISVAFIEFLFNFPHHFSYINPLFGGSHRVPIALNDSNFDYGQDLFYARDWVERHQAKSNDSRSSKVYGVLSGHGCYWLEGMVEPATVAILQKAIQVKKKVEGSYRVAHSSTEPMSDLLIVSRGLFHPEPWAVGNSKLGDDPLDAEELLLVQELLSHRPDVWITPVVVAYRLSARDDETLRD